VIGSKKVKWVGHVAHMEERDYLEGLGVDEKVTLQLMLEMQVWDAWTGLI